MFSSNRREFLKIVAAASLCPAGLAAAEAKPISATRLTDNLTLITGAGGNIVALNNSDGLLLVNGSLLERTSDLTRFLSEQFPAKRVGGVFNTDWHIEHTGSNEVFRKSGTKVLAHENTKLWMSADFISDWENKRYKPRPADALPNQTFYTSGSLTFGGERVEYGHMFQAHTDGDIYVFFPQQNVLVTGDVMSVGQYPILDYVTGGWIGGLQNANQALLKVANAQTQIVPGAGPVQTRADLQSQADMCNAMRDRLVKLMRQGMGPQDMIAAAPSKDFDTKWGNPELFIKNAYRGMWGHVRELGGII
jgi:glyoxylase-like metal-dependent hydrolase (beta-lactamase superfamily II)